jgi:TetR/AcrR family transcriptional regulator, regulator of autoinduction and epiphytic fitness
MPLPRFERLAPDARAAILAVARTHFARDGKDAASFNRIIADSGISKTTAYHYFDGKDDLFAAVVADTAGRTLAALGDWADVAAADALMEQVADGARRLAAHLREHPDDRAVLAAAPAERRNPWIERLVANGLRIGLIDPYPGAELTAAATAAVIGAVDDWALHRPGRLDESAAQVLTVLLKRLWNTGR